MAGMAPLPLRPWASNSSGSVCCQPGVRLPCLAPSISWRLCRSVLRSWAVRTSLASGASSGLSPGAASTVAADQPERHQHVEHALDQGGVEPYLGADGPQFPWLGQQLQQPGFQGRGQGRERPHRAAQLIEDASYLLAWIHARPSCSTSVWPRRHR
jgi:hypothetical protein